MFKQLVSVCWCYLICICLRSLVVATPTLSVTNAAQLNTAAETVIQNLLALYQPNADGVYNQIATPWFASGMIWDMILGNRKRFLSVPFIFVSEYTRWTGNKGNSQFANTAIGALGSSPISLSLADGSKVVQRVFHMVQQLIFWMAQMPSCKVRSTSS